MNKCEDNFSSVNKLSRDVRILLTQTKQKNAPQQQGSSVFIFSKFVYAYSKSCQLSNVSIMKPIQHSAYVCVCAGFLCSVSI